MKKFKNFIKTTLQYLLMITLLISTPFTFTYVEEEEISPNMAKALDQMFEGYSEKDLETLLRVSEELYQNLDPETKKQLDEMGEQWKREVDMGEDPDDALERIMSQDGATDFIPESPAEQIDESIEAEKTKPEKTEKETKKPTIIIDKDVVNQTQDLIQTIINKIAEIRAEASQKKNVEQRFYPLQYNLDDIVYYLEVIKEENIIKYLQKKEFEPLLKTLQNLHNSLVTYEPHFEVSPISLEGENPYTQLNLPTSASLNEVENAYTKLLNEKSPYSIQYKLLEEGKNKKEVDQALQKAENERVAITRAYHEIKEREQSKEALNNILESLGQAIFGDNIISQLEKLVNTYDPEALKLKKEQEKKESEARKKQLEEAQKQAWFEWAFDPREFGLNYEDFAPAEDKGILDYGDEDYDYPGSSTYEKPTSTSEVPSTGQKQPKNGQKPQKKPSSKKDKKSEKKDKEKKSKEAKPKKPKLSENTKFLGKIIEDDFAGLGDYMKDKKDILGQAQEYLQKPIARTITEEQKAETFNRTFDQLTEKISLLSKKIKRHYKGMEKQPLDQKWYKENVDNVIKKFNRSDLKKQLDELLKTENVDDAKKPLIQQLKKAFENLETGTKPEKEKPKEKKAKKLKPKIVRKRTRKSRPKRR